MNNVKLNDIAPAQVSVPGELTIVMWPRSHFTQYIGTRMQLESEGLIPKDTRWPDGYADIQWQAGGLDFDLRRQRPGGAKGTRRAFIDCDNWCLRIMPSGPEDAIDILVDRKAQELRELRYRQTPKGRAESNKAWGRYRAAQDDEAFQAFKLRVPALVSPPPKRRRVKAAL
ncbi:MAG TPA: hypothetical protein VF450_14805 [Noviherbaspirillum sp.]